MLASSRASLNVACAVSHFDLIGEPGASGVASVGSKSVEGPATGISVVGGATTSGWIAVGPWSMCPGVGVGVGGGLSVGVDCGISVGVAKGRRLLRKRHQVMNESIGVAFTQGVRCRGQEI